MFELLLTVKLPSELKLPELFAEVVTEKVRLFCAEISEELLSWFEFTLKLFAEVMRPELFN